MKTNHFFTKKDKTKKLQFEKVLVKICGANLGWTHPDEKFFGLNVAYQSEGKPVFQHVLVDMKDAQKLHEICGVKSERELINKNLYLYIDNTENIRGFAAV